MLHTSLNPVFHYDKDIQFKTITIVQFKSNTSIKPILNIVLESVLFIVNTTSSEKMT